MSDASTSETVGEATGDDVTILSRPDEIDPLSAEFSSRYTWIWQKNEPLPLPGESSFILKNSLLFLPK